MAQPSIKVVAFDVGGVLGGDVSAKKMLADRYADRQEVMAADFKSLWNQWKVEPEYTEQRYWEGVKSYLSFVQETPEELAQLTRERLEVFPDVVKVASDLKARGTSIGIISNHAISWYSDMAALGGFQTCFPDKMVVISQAAGCCKPNLSIYKYFWDLVHDAGLCKDAAEVLFIDDKPANIKAAESFGFQGLLFCRPNSSALQLQEELGKLGLLEPLGA